MSQGEAQGPRRPKVASRGVIWIALGGVIHALSLVLGRPIVVRGTSVPWGLVVVGIGLLLLFWDMGKVRRSR